MRQVSILMASLILSDIDKFYKYIYLYIYICIYVYVYVCISLYITYIYLYLSEREREREDEKGGRQVKGVGVFPARMFRWREACLQIPRQEGAWYLPEWEEVY